VDDTTPLCERDRLFPTYDNNVSPYRDIDKVLRYSDYLDEQTGQLNAANLEQLERDFACMSFVGTSGNSFEKGLSAAVKTVSPEMTGGTVENPTDESAPNHGLLRDSAKFSVIFVTDENDCSHGDAELDKRTGCGSDICAIANHPDWDGPPLTPIDDLAQGLKDNLTGSKGYDVENESIIAASIHGRSVRYGVGYPDGQPPLTMEACQAVSGQISESLAERTTCDTDFGTAYSGDRYDRFLRKFDPKQVFPRIPADPNVNLDGLICQPERIDNTLEQIGETIAGSVSSCITNVPFSCSADEDCPAYAFGEGTEQCLPFGESSDSYCNSGIQVRLYPGDNTLADLENHEYCVPGSINSTMVPGGCVVDPTQYEFSACPGAETSAISLNWTDSRYFNTLSGYNVELVYTLLTGEPEVSANNGGGAAN
jgi:hypothetical protein